VFLIKQYRKLVRNATVPVGTALSWRDFFCRELPSVFWWNCALCFL